MKQKFGRGSSGLVVKLGRVPLVCVLAFSAALPLDSCSSERASDDGSEAVGSVGLKVEVAPGVTLNAVTYTISGNGFSKTGSIDTSGSPVVNGTIGGIPAGDDYTIVLTATSVEGDTTFTGSADFDVTAGKTTSLTVHLRAKGKPTKNGSVSVNATLNVGPVVDELSVTPLTAYVGHTITLNGAASDADEGPSGLSYYWSSTGGVIADPIRASTTLTSATPGTFTISLTAFDGELSDSATTTVTFVRPQSDSDAGSGADAGTGAGPEHPNVLLIIADDLGAESTSLYPSLAGETGAVPIPNIEALAAQGLVFDNAWASPACSMTRGTIVTGQYAHRTGVTFVGAVLPTDTTTVFDRITAESPDYSQGLIGKYHLGGPNPTNTQHVTDIGVPYFKGILSGGVSDYFKWTTYSTEAAPFTNTTFATTALTDYGIDYIHDREAKRPDEPWFLYQAYNAPHSVGANSPYQVPPAELHHVDLSSVGNPAPGTIVTNIPVYKALIQSLDTEIGRLLAEVDLDKTTVIFIGDNGTPDPVKDTKTGIRGSKGSVYEGGFRVPLIVAGAGVTRRGREDDLFVSTDLFATILELTGLSVGHVENSYSIKPLFTDETVSSGRTHSFSETGNGPNNRHWAVKDNQYKLVYNNGVEELYDLVADPLEKHDLYSSEEHAAALAALRAEIDALKPSAPANYFP
ncbi:MAG TPA: sulfatase-like hydrolase/transferase [Polyangiaceae bacterium]|nr:sulfatase-like hydrolase/transferase [Polyangiaceae bacterium]